MLKISISWCTIHLSSTVSDYLFECWRGSPKGGGSVRRFKAKSAGRYRCSHIRYIGLHLLNQISGTSVFFCLRRPGTHALSEITISNYFPAVFVGGGNLICLISMSGFCFPCIFLPPSRPLFFLLAFILLILRFARDKLPSAFYTRSPRGQKARLVIYQMWEMSDAVASGAEAAISLNSHQRAHKMNGETIELSPSPYKLYSMCTTTKRPAKVNFTQ